MVSDTAEEACRGRPWRAGLGVFDVECEPGKAFGHGPIELALVLLVDAARRGVGLHSSSEFLVMRDDPTRWGRNIGHHVAGVASNNPVAAGCYVMTVEADTSPSPDDAERWFAMADICDRAGIVLIDWCVRGFATAGARFAGQGAVWCPKHVAGLG